MPVDDGKLLTCQRGVFLPFDCWNKLHYSKEPIRNKQLRDEFALIKSKEILRVFKIGNSKGEWKPNFLVIPGGNGAKFPGDSRSPGQEAINCVFVGGALVRFWVFQFC